HGPVGREGRITFRSSEDAMTKRVALLLAIVSLVTASASAQTIPTSTLSGKVSAGGVGIPGVTVTVKSDNLQGARRSTTSGAGDYIFAHLPPGDYTVTFELAGMQTVTRAVTLTAARDDRLEVALAPAKVSESVTVSAETPMAAAVETTQVSTNFKQKLIEVLPVRRTLSSVTLLAPGVNNNGPSRNDTYADADSQGNTTISGAMSYDSLFL